MIVSKTGITIHRKLSDIAVTALCLGAIFVTAGVVAAAFVRW